MTTLGWERTVGELRDSARDAGEDRKIPLWSAKVGFYSNPRLVFQRRRFEEGMECSGGMGTILPEFQHGNEVDALFI